MIYGGDKAIELPVLDLYDTSMMIASINAAKDLYDKGVLEMKDFTKKYNDFYSPIAKDMRTWYNNTTAPVNDAVNYLYSHGIDPTRSAEARSLIARVTNGVPVTLLAKLKLSAEVGKQYQAAKQKMMAAGLYNEDFERQILGGKTMEEWDTSKDGVFSASSPTEFLTLQAWTEPTFKGIDKHYLTKEQVESRGITYDPRKTYVGVTKDDMEQGIIPFLNSLSKTPLHTYYHNVAANNLAKRTGRPLSDITYDEAEAELVEEAIGSNNKYMTPLDVDADKFALLEQEYKNNVKLEGIRSANRIKETKEEYKLKQKYGEIGGGSSSDGTGVAISNARLIHDTDYPGRIEKLDGGYELTGNVTANGLDVDLKVEDYKVPADYDGYVEMDPQIDEPPVEYEDKLFYKYIDDKGQVHWLSGRPMQWAPANRRQKDTSLN